jgi:hypothetical protein
MFIQRLFVIDSKPRGHVNIAFLLLEVLSSRTGKRVSAQSGARIGRMLIPS